MATILRLCLKIVDQPLQGAKKPASVLDPPGGQDAEQDHGWPASRCATFAAV